MEAWRWAERRAALRSRTAAQPYQSGLELGGPGDDVLEAEEGAHGQQVVHHHGDGAREQARGLDGADHNAVSHEAVDHHLRGKGGGGIEERESPARKTASAMRQWYSGT